jgi:hypothetical protein
VSNAFVMKDENGAIGMRSSIISLFLSFIIYSLIVPIMHVIKDNYGDKSNFLVYLTIFQIFDKVFRNNHAMHYGVFWLCYKLFAFSIGIRAGMHLS